MRLETWSQTDIGLVRKSNQDSVGCFPDLGVFVVADGMGGRSEGEIASRIAVDTVHDLLLHELGTDAHKPRGEPHHRASIWRILLGLASRPRESHGVDHVDLRSAVSVANRRVFEEGRNRPEAPRGSMGTTIVVLLCNLTDARAEWAHVGDSRLYRVRGGDLELLTADHTLYGEEFWAQPHIPITVQHTNRLVRAVGINPDVEVTLGAGDLCPGDLYFMCSDGVSGMVKPDDLREELLRPAPITEMGPTLIKRALDGGGRDNATALLVRVLDG
jgi:protein phosphatase